MADTIERKRYSIAFILLVALAVAFSAVLAGCGVSETTDVQPQEEALNVDDVPEGKVLYFKVVTTRAEDGFTETQESWVDPVSGNFLVKLAREVKEIDGPNYVIVEACDGEFYEVYDSFDQSAARVSLSKVMEFNPEALDMQRQWLTRKREWVRESIEQDAASGETVVYEGREAVLYAGVRERLDTGEVGRTPMT